MHYYRSILETAGHTPLVRLKKIEERFYLPFSLYGKVERTNPSGSIKDRAAISMIRDGKKKGLIKDKTLIIEPTSGNMGISLAMISAYFGLPCHIYMPESASKERVALISAYGAEVILTPASEGMEGAVKRAEEEKKAVKDSFCPSQFDNPANPAGHFMTANEILEDLDGNVSCVVAGIGTGGTITGIAKLYKELGRTTSIVGVEPASSPLLTKDEVGPHKIEGLGPNFKPSILASSLLHAVIDVSDEDAFEGARLLATEEGILSGISSGAALMGALKLEERYHKGGNVVVILPDGGDRYLSVPGLYGKN